MTVGGPLPAMTRFPSRRSSDLDKAGTGYTLTASSGTLSGGPSSAFNITARSAAPTSQLPPPPSLPPPPPPATHPVTHLGFSVQPTRAEAGAAIKPAVNVASHAP